MKPTAAGSSTGRDEAPQDPKSEASGSRRRLAPDNGLGGGTGLNLAELLRARRLPRVAPVGPSWIHDLSRRTCSPGVVNLRVAPRALPANLPGGKASSVPRTTAGQAAVGQPSPQATSACLATSSSSEAAARPTRDLGHVAICAGGRRPDGDRPGHRRGGEPW